MRNGAPPSDSADDDPPSAPRSAPGGLPAELNRLVGRDAELGALLWARLSVSHRAVRPGRGGVRLHGIGAAGRRGLDTMAALVAQSVVIRDEAADGVR
ncbi:hypothetical protein GCM10009753_43490 [Streptantibioticus ferralitis]